MGVAVPGSVPVFINSLINEPLMNIHQNFPIQTGSYLFMDSYKTPTMTHRVPVCTALGMI